MYINPIIKSELCLTLKISKLDVTCHVSRVSVSWCDKMLACDAATLGRDVTALYNTGHDNTIGGRAFKAYII